MRRRRKLIFKNWTVDGYLSPVRSNMANILRRVFFGGEKHTQEPKRPQVKTEDVHQTIVDNQPHNPYSEARLLHGHSHAIHQITTIDSKRFVTVSEDCLVVVWDAETGCRLQTLRGHSAAVTCVLALRPSSSDKCLILTGSMDATLRLWSLNGEERIVWQEGPCERIITDHRGPVKCLTQLNHNLICSGGRDLCLWDRSGNLMDKFDRSRLLETSDIHSMLMLDGMHLGVVAASNYKCLAVYDIEKPPMTDRDCYRFKTDQKRQYLTQSHNQPITCLASISATFFASGSCAGVIIVWSIQHLNAMKIFQCLPLPSKELAMPLPYVVSSIQVIHERYLFAAVGTGFKMYDVNGHEKDQQGHPKPLVSHTYAHSAPVTCLEFLEGRSVLLTASEDNTVRMWGHPGRQRRDGEAGEGQKAHSRVAIENFMGVKLHPPDSRKLPTVVPSLLGELLLHAGEVKVVRSVGDHGVVTCAVDGSIILWKEGESERERRELDIRSFLQGTNHRDLPE